MQKGARAPGRRAEKDMDVGSSVHAAAAASSSTSTPDSGVIDAAGIVSPRFHAATAARLPVPSTRNNTRRASDNRAALNDTRSGGGLGASKTASTSGESSCTPQS